jgi:chemotaxis protein MotB
MTGVQGVPVPVSSEIVFHGQDKELAMLRRVSVFVFSFCLLTQFGCVGQNTYQKKIDEASDLTKDLADARKKNADLYHENEEMRAKLDRLDSTIGELEAGKKSLEDLLAKKQDTPTLKIAEQAREIENLKGDLASLRREREGKVRDVSILYEGLLERMKDEIAHGRTSVTELRGAVTVSFPEEVLFDRDSDDVKPGGVTVIRKVAELLANVHDRNVRVETSFVVAGEPETAGKRRTAWESAATRAVVVANLLRGHGVGPEVINAGISGGFKAGGGSGDAIARAKDRRVEITIISKE